MLFGRSIAGALAFALATAGPALADTYDLVIDRTKVRIDGQERLVFSINGDIPPVVLHDWLTGGYIKRPLVISQRT